MLDASDLPVARAFSCCPRKSACEHRVSGCLPVLPVWQAFSCAWRAQHSRGPRSQDVRRRRRRAAPAAGAQRAQQPGAAQRLAVAHTWRRQAVRRGVGRAAGQAQSQARPPGFRVWNWARPAANAWAWGRGDSALGGRAPHLQRVCGWLGSALPASKRLAGSWDFGGAIVGQPAAEHKRCCLQPACLVASPASVCACCWGRPRMRALRHAAVRALLRKACPAGCSSCGGWTQTPSQAPSDVPRFTDSLCYWAGAGVPARSLLCCAMLGSASWRIARPVIPGSLSATPSLHEGSQGPCIFSQLPAVNWLLCGLCAQVPSAFQL